MKIDFDLYFELTETKPDLEKYVLGLEREIKRQRSALDFSQHALPGVRQGATQIEVNGDKISPELQPDVEAYYDKANTHFAKIMGLDNK